MLKKLKTFSHQGCESVCATAAVSESSAGDGWRVLALLEGEGDVGGVAGVANVRRQGLRKEENSELCDDVKSESVDLHSKGALADLKRLDVFNSRIRTKALTTLTQ